MSTTTRFGKTTVRIEGLAEMYAKLAKIAPAAAEIGRKLINVAVEETYNGSQALVPVDAIDGGQLKASGTKQKARINKKTNVVTGAVVYGGAKLMSSAIPKVKTGLYAIVQHEDLMLRHDSGQAKYVEIPAVLAGRTLLDALSQELSNIADVVNAGIGTGDISGGIAQGDLLA